MKTTLAFLAAFSFATLCFAKEPKAEFGKVDRKVSDCYHKCGMPMQKCMAKCGQQESCAQNCADDLQQCTAKCPKPSQKSLRE